MSTPKKSQKSSRAKPVRQKKKSDRNSNQLRDFTSFGSKAEATTSTSKRSSNEVHLAANEETKTNSSGSGCFAKCRLTLTHHRPIQTEKFDKSSKILLKSEQESNNEHTCEEEKTSPERVKPVVCRPYQSPKWTKLSSYPSKEGRPVPEGQETWEV